MPSGWDNHPEYGGPEPTWRGAFVIALVIVVIAGLIVLAVKWKHPLRLTHQVVQQHELTRMQIFRIVHATGKSYSHHAFSGRPLTFRALAASRVRDERERLLLGRSRTSGPNLPAAATRFTNHQPSRA